MTISTFLVFGVARVSVPAFVKRTVDRAGISYLTQLWLIPRALPSTKTQVDLATMTIHSKNNLV